MPRKPKKKEEEKVKESYEEGSFTVEVITRARVNCDGNGWEYYVKWYAYPDEDNSWEPEDNLKGCQRLLQSFWESVGFDNADYPAGFHLDASDSWIKKESAFCRSEMKKEAKRKREKEQEREKKEMETAKSKGKDKSKEKVKEKKPTIKKHSLSSQVAQEPISAKGKERTVALVLDDSSSDSVQPVSSQTISVKRKLGNRTKVIDLSESESESVSRAPSKRKVSSDKDSTSPGPSKKIKTISASSERNDELFGPLFSDSDDEPDVPLAKLTSKPTVNPTAKSIPKPSTAPIIPPPAVKNLIPTRGTVPNTVGAGTSASASTGSLVPNSANGSKLATKARIGSDALMLINPKQKPSARLSGLSFKKNKDLISPTTPQVTSPSVAQALNPSWNVSSSVTNSHADAERFLNSMNLDNSADDSWQATADTWNDFSSNTVDTGSASSAPRAERKTSLQQQETEQWKWEGTLIRATEKGTATLCKARLTNVTEHGSNEHHIEALLENALGLEFGKMRPRSDLDLLLTSFKSVQQFATLKALPNEPLKPLRLCYQYMMKKQMFAMSPLYPEHDHEPVAFLVIFPAGMDELRNKLSAPSPSNPSDTFITALFHWDISPEVARQYEWRTGNAKRSYSNQTDRMDKTEQTLLRSRPEASRAPRLLDFPGPDSAIWQALKRGREIFIWDNAKELVESSMLLGIFHLFRPNTKVKSALKSPRWIFVHNAEIKSLRYLPNFKTLRRDKPELQIFSYGTDRCTLPGSVFSSRHGIHEIFPHGGIVTFTPSAFMLNPIQCLSLISKTGQHPLWDCYLLPAVAGLLSIHFSGEQDPLQAFDEHDYVLTRLFNYAENKDILLSQMPPDRTSPSDSSLLQQWMFEQCYLLDATGRSILERCLNVFKGSFANVPQSQWNSTLNARICEDISLMQQQDHILDSYRRFVVIATDEELEFSQDNHTVEVIKIEDMQFGDISPKDDDDYLARLRGLTIKDEPWI